MKLIAALALPFYALDQLTKWAILRTFPLHDSQPVIPGFFNLVHVTNTGAAFGSFSDSNGFFIGLSILTLIALVILFVRGAFPGRLNETALGLLVSGILGNLTDRLLHGHVIDFLDFQFGSYHWPAFNVADSCICVAATLFVILSVFDGKKEAR